MKREDELLTRKEAALKLKRSVKTVTRLVAAGKLREERLPTAGTRSAPYYKQSSIDAFIASGYHSH